MARYGYGNRDVSVTYRTAYLDGAAARELENYASGFETVETGRSTHRKRKTKKNEMSFGYMMFLVLALVLAVFSFYSYISLRSEITKSVKAISKMEKEYNALKMENDETYARIVSSVNLEDVKAVAIGELGMEYASEGQIVVVVDEQADYVRQEGNLK